MQIATAMKSTEQGKWREGGSTEQRSMSRRQNEVRVQLLTHCMTLKVCCPCSHLLKEGLEREVTDISSSSDIPGSGRW